jgi:hypothetical protein
VSGDERVTKRLAAREPAGHLRPVLDAEGHPAAAVARRGLGEPSTQRNLAQLEISLALDSLRFRYVTLTARQQEAHLGRDLALALDDALELQMVMRALERTCVRGRVDDPERRRGRVLGRARRVRVERVALVEQRVDELVDAHPRPLATPLSHSSPAPPSRSSTAPSSRSPTSSATHASSVGDARRAFSRWRATSVSSRSAIHPVPG